MTMRNTDERWGWPSMTLHWGIATLVLVLLMVGLIMVELPRSPKYFWVYDLHKSIGLTVLLLTVVRLCWRLYAGAPKPEPGTASWQNFAAQAAHWALYALTFAMPISGWLYDSASGLRVLKYFGLVTVPKLTGPNQEVKNLALDFHQYGAWILIALIFMHIGGALVHHLMNRDRTLWRMLPRSFEKS